MVVSINVISHELKGVTLGKTPLLFLSSGVHTSVAAGDIVGVDDSSSTAREYLAAVEAIPDSCSIAVLYEHQAGHALLGAIAAKAQAYGQVIIAPLGRLPGENVFKNSVAVATPTGLVITDKISFSEGDIRAATEDGVEMTRGGTLHLFESNEARLAILNCHDYTHADLINAVLAHKVDILVITSRNKATRLYKDYAASDIHRLCCFVVVNNVSDYGGTGVYAPFSRVGGKEEGHLSLGGSLFETQGPSEVSGLIPIPLGELRGLRDSFPGLGTAEDASYEPIDPPEHIKFHPKPPPFHERALSHPPETINLSKLGYRRNRQGNIRVAVAQLRSATMNEYLDNSYHISRSPSCKTFESKIRSHLAMLEKDTAALGNVHQPDFLVFPEVFLPLTLEDEIRAFAVRNNTIVIAGVEYDPQLSEQLYGTEHARGINRCRVYTPANGSAHITEYQKLSRSRYDARFTNSPELQTAQGPWGSFQMELGTRQFRFEADGIGTFGILICYDLSHFDLVHALNLGSPLNSVEPVDVLFVVAHNPYAELYRRCCLADCHRFYQYVVMCNVSQYGGSGIFAPLHTPGERRTLLHAGKNVEGILLTEIDTAGLAEARKSVLRLTGGSAAKTSNLNGDGAIRFQRHPGALSTRLQF